MAAVDLLTNAEDGLTAHLHDQQGFTLIQSDFDHLPLEGIRQFEKTDFDLQKILSQARQFSQERFRSEWQSFFKGLGLNVPMG